MAATTQRETRMTDTDIPAGFEPHFRKSPLTDPWEPLYSKKTDKAVDHRPAAGKAAHQCARADPWRPDRGAGR